MLPARTVSISIARPRDAVYKFVADAFNMPRWAPGFCQTIAPEPGAAGRWRITTTDGTAHARFVAPNEHGVVDHWVTVVVEGAAPTGEIYVPLRVVANGDGSEVLLTVFRLPTMSDGDFDKDVAAVEADLARLKEMLEAKPAG